MRCKLRLEGMTVEMDALMEEADKRTYRTGERKKVGYEERESMGRRSSWHKPLQPRAYLRSNPWVDPLTNSRLDQLWGSSLALTPKSTPVLLWQEMAG
jgi:hypothetical protein